MPAKIKRKETLPSLHLSLILMFQIVTGIPSLSALIKYQTQSCVIIVVATVIRTHAIAKTGRECSTPQGQRFQPPSTYQVWELKRTSLKHSGMY